MSVPKPLSLARIFLERVIRPGDRVVDATLGNGHDALYLAQAVGPQGRVTGFDIQEQALATTRARLAEANMSDRCDLHLRCHSELGKLINEGQRAIVFNLGYLPGADKACITRTKSTLEALDQASRLLLPGGLLSVMCYPGHDGGDEESEAVSVFLGALPREMFRVHRYEMTNGLNRPPFLLVADKVRQAHSPKASAAQAS